MSIDRRRTSGGYFPLRDAMQQLFESSVISPQTMGGQGGFPSADLYSTDDNVVLCMSIPGARPDDINVQIVGESVSVSGDIKHEHQTQKGHTYFDEIWQGQFQRTFRLPIEVDPNKAKADFENGILTVTMPKSESTKPRKIQVQGGQGQQRVSGSGTTGSSQGTTQKETVPVNTGSSS